MNFFGWGQYCTLFYLLISCFLHTFRYVESNPQYAESSVYLLKFRQLQVSDWCQQCKKIDFVNGKCKCGRFVTCSKWWQSFCAFNSLEPWAWFELMCFLSWKMLHLRWSIRIYIKRSSCVCTQAHTCFSVNMNLCDFVVYLWTSSGSACNPEHWRQQNIYFRGCRGICNLCQIQSSLNWGSSIFLFVLLSWHEDVMHVEFLTTDNLSKQ